MRTKTVSRIGLLPLHGAWALVAVVDVAHELSPQISHRGEYTAGNHVALDPAERELRLVESRGIGSAGVRLHGSRSQATSRVWRSKSSRIKRARRVSSARPVPLALENSSTVTKSRGECTVQDLIPSQYCRTYHKNPRQHAVVTLASEHFLLYLTI